MRRTGVRFRGAQIRNGPAASRYRHQSLAAEACGDFDRCARAPRSKRGLPGNVAPTLFPVNDIEKHVRIGFRRSTTPLPPQPQTKNALAYAPLGRAAPHRPKSVTRSPSKIRRLPIQFRKEKKPAPVVVRQMRVGKDQRAKGPKDRSARSPRTYLRGRTKTNRRSGFHS
jgi:hypothetical protein